MTLPLRRFCSTQARFGRAIQTGFPLTAKRMSVASAWRVAMATTVPFQRQWSCSPVKRSLTVKSSYMALAYQGSRPQVVLYRMLTAPAAIRATVANEMNDWIIISTLAHRVRTGLSVGENAVLVLKARNR